MSTVGILGGTFDPVHHGHLITAQALVELRRLDKIIFIPAYISPHKTEISHSDALHRLNMVRLAVENIPYFDYSPLEAEKPEVSYSIDTLRVLKEKFDNIELIIGYDNIEKFHTWKEPDEILKLAKLVVMKRSVDTREINKDRFYNAATFVNTPFIDITATEIRNRIRKNLPVDFLVPDKVKEYIMSNGLYKY